MNTDKEQNGSVLKRFSLPSQHHSADKDCALRLARRDTLTYFPISSCVLHSNTTGCGPSVSSL